MMSALYITATVVCGATPLSAILAGVSTADPGPVAPDGYNVWPALASGGSVPSPRTFIIHEYDELEGIFAYRSVRLPNLVLFGLLLWKHL